MSRFIWFRDSFRLHVLFRGWLLFHPSFHNGVLVTSALCFFVCFFVGTALFFGYSLLDCSDSERWSVGPVEVLGLAAALIGVLHVLGHIAPLRRLCDVFSAPATVTGTIERWGLRGKDPIKGDEGTYYVTIDSKEYEIARRDLDGVGAGQHVTLTYWPNSRIVAKVSDILPACGTSTASAIARAIVEERAYDRLPVLADALEEAGCRDAEILRRCRETGDPDECQRLLVTLLQYMGSAE